MKKGKRVFKPISYNTIKNNQQLETEDVKDEEEFKVMDFEYN